MEIMDESNFIFFCSLATACIVTVAWAGISQYLCKKRGQKCDEPFHLIKPVKLAKDKNPLSSSGWTGPLVTIGGILGTVLSSNKNQAFTDFSILFVVIFLVASLLDSAVSKPSRTAHVKHESDWKRIWHRMRWMSQYVAGGLALWSVVGQIWATWFLMGLLTLTPILVGASRLFLAMAVALVVAYDVMDVITSQKAHERQQMEQSLKQSPTAHVRQHSIDTVPLPATSDGQGRVEVKIG